MTWAEQVESGLRARPLSGLREDDRARDDDVRSFEYERREEDYHNWADRFLDQEWNS